MVIKKLRVFHPYTRLLSDGGGVIIAGEESLLPGESEKKVFAIEIAKYKMCFKRRGDPEVSVRLKLN